MFGVTFQGTVSQAWATSSSTPNGQAGMVTPSKPGVAAHTASQIRSFYSNSALGDFDDYDLWYLPTDYDSMPLLVSPYEAGSLSEDVQTQSLAALNLVRYIAGVDANVTINSNYNTQVQAGCLINAVQGELSHDPDQPRGMSTALYQQGVEGLQGSNIAYGYTNIPVSIIMGYMDDSDDTSIKNVGHRRWMLSPSLGQTGFGYVSAYSGVYAFDHSNSGASQKNVVWPAQTMPVEFFSPSSAWSISVGERVTATKVNVVLTRLSDNRQWEFNSTEADGDFYVDNGNYGLTGCIIFRPEGLSQEFMPGDEYRVQVTGTSTPLDYTVNFFALFPYDDVENDAWYADAVYWATDNGLLSGYAGTDLFGVDDPMTRAQMATMLWRYRNPETASKYVAANAVNETDLNDVADHVFYTGAANWAVANDVITGIVRSNGTRIFAPDQDVTFQQLIVIMARMFGSERAVNDADTSILSDFNDGRRVSSWARPSMAWAIEQGYVVGSDGYLWPESNVARARVATVLQRFINGLRL